MPNVGKLLNLVHELNKTLNLRYNSGTHLLCLLTIDTQTAGSIDPQV